MKRTVGLKLTSWLDFLYVQIRFVGFYHCKILESVSVFVQKPGCLAADYIIQLANSIPSFCMKTILTAVLSRGGPALCSALSIMEGFKL